LAGFATRSFIEAKQTGNLACGTGESDNQRVMCSRRTVLHFVTAFAAVAALWGCTTSHEGREPACSGDAECDPGTVCRVARCRKACASNHWVGEDVKVKTEQGDRTALVSGCDGVASPTPNASASSDAPKPPGRPPRLWVRYESGIEEQVVVSRVKPELAAQANAK